MRPFEMKEPFAPTNGPRKPHHHGKVCLNTYNGQARDASPGLAERVLRRAESEVRDEPCRLPLTAHRLGGLVNAGKLAYQRTWDALYEAALDGGAAESWVRRCLFHGFAASHISSVPSPQLWQLLNGIY